MIRPTAATAGPARPTVSLIAAIARNGAIGRSNGLLWQESEDQKHFRRVTMGCPVIMGRKTWDSIGKPLRDRRNIVVTRNASWHACGAEHASSFDQALALCAEDVEAFVIGGAELFSVALSRADRAIITQIDRDIDGDIFFPALDASQWIETSREEHVASGPDALPFAFVHYARRAPTAR